MNIGIVLTCRVRLMRRCRLFECPLILQFRRIDLGPRHSSVVRYSAGASSRRSSLKGDIRRPQPEREAAIHKGFRETNPRIPAMAGGHPLRHLFKAWDAR